MKKILLRLTTGVSSPAESGWRNPLVVQPSTLKSFATRARSALMRLKRRWDVILFTFTLVAASSTAWAFYWGQQVTITLYYAYAGGNAYIVTSNNQNPDNCTQSNYLELDSSQPLYSSLYATVISAYATGQTVSINYNGCSSTGYPLVNAIAVPHI